MSATVLLGITGGIAAYKTPILVRLLKRAGRDVHVVMTEAATRFVTPLTLATLSENRVHCDQWRDPWEPGVEHIALADRADAAVIAPATANFVGKLASGIADDLLTTVMTAITCPVLICPSMNVNMYRNRIFQRNLERLKEAGYQIMEPDAGWLACGWEGEGRMPEPELIAAEMERLLAPDDLVGERILVTSGPTEEPIDPVRFISNPSSGKMGVAVARRAACRGAEVTLVAGPMKIPAPPGVRHVKVRTAEEMYQRVMELADDVGVVIKAAAVADFRPCERSSEKLKKDRMGSTLELVRTRDILLELGSRRRDGQILVGFAAETDEVLKHGREKLRKKNLDMLVLNDVSEPGAGFNHDTNIVRFLHRNGKEEQMELMSKDRVADLILDRVRDMRNRIHTAATGPLTDKTEGDRP